jgi:histone acetyltransferase (RNA polymerase elongator complex component)
MGIRRLYLGIEGGLDDVLAFMQKDHDTEQAHREIRRLQGAGLLFNAHIMTGVAGAGQGLENAEKLAEFFNRTQPERIVNFSLFLSRKAPLYRDILAGRFIPADERENLEEAHRLLELLETNAQYDGFHDQLGLRVWGTLPQDRQKMLQKLDNAIAVYAQREPMVAYA